MVYEGALGRMIDSDQIVATVREPLLILDKDLKVVSANPAFIRFFKVSEPEIRGQFIFDLGNGQWNIPRLRDLLKEVHTKGRDIEDYVVDHDFPLIGHKIMLVNVRPIPCAWQSSPLMLLAFEDATDRILNLRRTEKLMDDLINAKDSLDRFATIAAHDLQSPLNRALGFSDLFSKSAGTRMTDKERHYIDMFQTQLSAMRALINDLLTFARFKEQPENAQEVDLSELVAEVRNQLDDQFREVGGELDVAQLPAVRGMRSQLRQLFANLLENALKYRRPDVRPVITIASNAAKDGGIEIAIKDNGEGFEKDEADLVFQPFLRLHPSGGGTGLGLAICRRVMENHHGTISSQSEPKMGATFTMRFPPETVA